MDYLLANAALQILIQGHTDSVGNEVDNLQLSEQRARKVAEYLVQQGIHTNRIQCKGYGETVPLTQNKTEEGRAINRRVALEIMK